MEIELSNPMVSVYVMIPYSRCGLKPMLTKLACEPQLLQEEINSLTPKFTCLTLPVYTNLETIDNAVPALESVSI